MDSGWTLHFWDGKILIVLHLVTQCTNTEVGKTIDISTICLTFCGISFVSAKFCRLFLSVKITIITGIIITNSQIPD